MTFNSLNEICTVSYFLFNNNIFLVLRSESFYNQTKLFLRMIICKKYILHMVKVFSLNEVDSNQK